MGATAGAAGAGAALCAAVLALVPPVAWAAYSALYAGSAISRTVATLQTEVSPSWSSPTVSTTEASVPGNSARQ